MTELSYPSDWMYFLSFEAIKNRKDSGLLAVSHRHVNTSSEQLRGDIVTLSVYRERKGRGQRVPVSHPSRKVDLIFPSYRWER